MSKHWFGFLAAVVLAASVGVAFADTVEGESLADPKAEAEAYEIASRTMSPFCPGRTLADCPSGNATEWRQDIRRMLTEGKSAAEIQQILSARAGENLSGAPESSVGWALPVGLCLGALIVLTLVIQRFRHDDAGSQQAGSTRRRARPDAAAEDEDAEDDAAEDEDAEDTEDDDADDEDDDDAAADDENRAASAKQSRRDQELEERLRRELADEEGAS